MCRAGGRARIGFFAGAGLSPRDAYRAGHLFEFSLDVFVEGIAARARRRGPGA
ncbi:hypothetical protein [Streptomyces niveus]|uniref:hypothetical protein n=1 Tax=Streptomyces niveus TaxID=193462 RepID=UPI003673DFBF